MSEVTDDPGSGGVTPPRHTGAQAHRSQPPGTQVHLPELSSQTILLGVGQRWGGGLISNILRILAPSLRVLRLISSTLFKSHDSNRFAQISLLEEKEAEFFLHLAKYLTAKAPTLESEICPEMQSTLQRCPEKTRR